MYISKIELEDIRGFKELKVNFEKDNKIKKWLTILGDNAVGKSTILKCIAMGLSDQSSAAGLMKEDDAAFIRRGETKGKIIITLKEDNIKKSYPIITILTKAIKGDNESPEILNQQNPQNLSLWKNVFLCGYGVQIGDGGGKTWDKYNSLESVYTLFNTGSDLQDAEGVMFKQEDDVRESFSRLIEKILMLDGYKEIEYNTKGMYVHGPWGKFRVNELSDGYRRLIQIVVDFFGWQIVSNRLKVVGDKISGILVIDELETHLHPRLQRFVVDRLRTHLPDVQIITTTHSPLVALGTSDVEDGLMLELDLAQDGTNQVRYECVDSNYYKGYSVDQILTSTVFDLPIAQSGVAGDKVVRYRELFRSNNRNREEEEEYKKLKKEIENEMPELGEKEDDRNLQIEIREMLDKINNELNDSTKKKA